MSRSLFLLAGVALFCAALTPHAAHAAVRPDEVPSMNATIHPGDTGPAVELLHQQLAERGVLPPAAIDEERAQHYGCVTQGAVATFQAQHGLEVDGIVGQRTWDAITLGIDQPAEVPPLDVATASSVGRLALIVADTAFKAHVAEEPLGSNRGPAVDQYLVGLRGDGRDLLHARAGGRCADDGWQGAPWCGRFARFCVDTAAVQLGQTSPIASAGDLASAVKWFAWARFSNRLTLNPAPGRVGVILVPAIAGHQPHGHLVLLAAVDGDRLGSREGNSSNRVAARWRTRSEFAGFVDLA